MKIKIKKGLSIPIAGEPEQTITNAAPVSSVAVLGSEVNGLQPRMQVEVGDIVRLGQTLFTDKANSEIPFTSPGAGRVIAINRGARRVLQSVVVALEGDDSVEFKSYAPQQQSELSAATIRDVLLQSGMWTALRTRPFSRIPSPDLLPTTVFVTAIDTNPLAPDPSHIIAESSNDFVSGLQILERLSEGIVHVCVAAGANIVFPESESIRRSEFTGPHPAGLVGTHIHFLEPVSENKLVWHIAYQDVIAIGSLFTSGHLSTKRIVAMGGPKALQPRLLRTRPGASVADLIRNEVADGPLRIVSGSVLSGHRASGPLAWLGRYHNQISVLGEGEEREFLSWMRPGFSKYSSLRAYAAHLFQRGNFPMTTTQNGSPRAIVPIGSFERVMPLDILPTPLLKALLVKDTDRARELGCLELDEEDLALCSFVCNGKYEYGPFLRMTLDEIEANG